jgi:hypothetical protein
MGAFVVVVDTPHFAVATSGRATLSLPPGRYQIRVWAPGRHREPPSQAVDLAAGESRELRFQIGR